MQGVCAVASEGQNQGNAQAVRALFVACDLCGGGPTAVEALRQSIVSREAKGLKCEVCGREAVSDLCRYHEGAKWRVKEAYPRWVRAYGKMEWKDYLDSVKRNPQTGQWAKEIAEFLKGDSG